jgi:hypothetical protein
MNKIMLTQFVANFWLEVFLEPETRTGIPNSFLKVQIKVWDRDEINGIRKKH